MATAKKKEQGKNPAKKDVAPVEQEKAGGQKNDKVRRYHVSQHPDGWAVKFATGEKAIKVFKTQKEAHDYAVKMAENQKGRGVKASVVVHSKEGKLRKMH